jgi:hypothetical protein
MQPNGNLLKICKILWFSDFFKCPVGTFRAKVQRKKSDVQFKTG